MTMIRSPGIVTGALAALFFSLGGCSSKADPKGPGAQNQGDLATFVNSKAGLPQRLLDHYVDFSFQHPRSWKVVRDQKNFVQVQRLETLEKPDDHTVESVFVGSFWHTESKGRPDNLARTLADVAHKMNKEGAAQFPDYQKVSDGPVTLAGIRGHEYRYQFRLGPPQNEIPFFGRTIILPHPSGQGDGLILLMLVSSLAPGVSGVEDVGVKGEMPVILRTFRVGK